MPPLWCSVARGADRHVPGVAASLVGPRTLRCSRVLVAISRTRPLFGSAPPEVLRGPPLSRICQLFGQTPFSSWESTPKRAQRVCVTVRLRACREKKR